MNKQKLMKGLLAILIVFVVAVAVTKIIQYPTKKVEKYHERLLYERNSGADIAVAFATALRLNSEVMYEVTDPGLWPELDEWMSHHQVKECDVWELFELGGELMISMRSKGYNVIFYCELENDEFYTFEVNNIEVRGSFRVFGWGAIIEEGILR